MPSLSSSSDGDAGHGRVTPGSPGPQLDSELAGPQNT